MTGGEIPLAFVAGFAVFLSPCTIPVLPVVLATIGAAPDATFRRRMAAAALFVAGFSSAFVALGGGIGLLAVVLVPQLVAIRWLFGALLVAFGLLLVVDVRRFAGKPALTRLAGTYGFADRIARRLSSERPLRKAFLVGLGFGFAWTPCVGPLLGGILTLAANAGSAAGSALLLASFSAGYAVPTLVAAAVSATLFGFLRRFGRSIRIASGALFIAYGAVIALGKLPEIVRPFW